MPTDQLKSVAVIGAGLMGHGIAQVFMTAGYNVRIWDPDHDTLAAVPERITDHLRLIGKDIPVTVHLAGSLADAAVDADLVIEAIPEDLTLKQDLCAELDHLAPRAVLATNTSVLRIGDIAAGSAHPERIIGTHWWNPPYLIPIVEVIPSAQTAREITDQTLRWLDQAGQTPVIVRRDVPGFIGNRLQFALWREAMHLIEEGICDAETVDMVARGTFGRRLAAIGPIENADFIGLDLTSAIMTYLLPHLATNAQPPALLRDLVGRDHLGAKTGSGLGTWPPGRRQDTEQRLLRHLTQTTHNASTTQTGFAP